MISLGTPLRPLILLAEDNRSHADVLVVLLGSGFDVIRASDGMEVRARFATHGMFDVILSDVFMPRMGGYALLQWARDVKPEIVERFVFLTSDLGTNLARALAKTHRVLQKPVGVLDLHAAVQAVLAKR